MSAPPRPAGYRSRAAFKLLEIDDKSAAEAGPAGGRSRRRAGRLDPGGRWRTDRARGRVVALDLLAMDPIPGAIVLQGDFQDPAAEQAVLAALAGQADLVLSDMAPNTTGHNATDHLRIIGLAELALDFAVGSWRRAAASSPRFSRAAPRRAPLDQIKRRFAVVRHIKPPASRKDSAELYVVATGFRPAAPGPPADAAQGRAQANRHAAALHLPPRVRV